jgi:hypothetical protein
MEGRARTTSKQAERTAPPAPAEEPSTATVVCARGTWRPRGRLKMSSATSSMRWMFAHASARGSSAASMAPRWIPLLQATLPPTRAIALVSWLAAYRSASSSRPQNAVEAAPL